MRDMCAPRNPPLVPCSAEGQGRKEADPGTLASLGSLSSLSSLSLLPLLCMRRSRMRLFGSTGSTLTSPGPMRPWMYSVIQVCTMYMIETRQPGGRAVNGGKRHTETRRRQGKLHLVLIFGGPVHPFPALLVCSPGRSRRAGRWGRFPPTSPSVGSSGSSGVSCILLSGPRFSSAHWAK